MSPSFDFLLLSAFPPPASFWGNRSIFVNPRIIVSLHFPQGFSGDARQADSRNDAIGPLEGLPEPKEVGNNMGVEESDPGMVSGSMQPAQMLFLSFVCPLK